MKLAGLKVNNFGLVSHEVEQFEDVMKSKVLFTLDLIHDIKKNNETNLIPEYLKFKEIVVYSLFRLEIGLMS